MELPLAHATLTVDGHTVIRDGHLVTSVTVNSPSAAFLVDKIASLDNCVVLTPQRK